MKILSLFRFEVLGRGWLVCQLRRLVWTLRESGLDSGDGRGSGGGFC